MRAVLLLLVCCGLGLINSKSVDSWSSPGFKASVTSPALAKLANLILKFVNSDLDGLKVPDFQTQTHVPVVGTVTISLTDIVVQSFDCTNVSISLTSPSAISASVTNMAAKISANYKWKEEHGLKIHGSGSVDITPDAGTIGANIGLSTLNSQAHVQVQSASCDITHFSIKFHGSWLSWLYDLIADLLNHDLKKTIDKTVQDEIASVVNVRVNALLAKIPLVETLGKGPDKLDLYLNVTELTAQPGYAAVGMLMSVADPTPDSGACPLAPVAMPDTSGGNYLQFFFADAVVGCMSYYEFMNGEIDFIANPTVTPGFPLLNTSDWSLFIPQLAKQFPNSALQLEFIAVTPPTFQFISSQVGAAASARFDMNMSVMTANGSLIATNTLELDASGSLDITAGMKGANATLFANMTSLSLNVSVASSNIGPLNPILLETIAKELGPAIMKAVNVLGAMGLPLPTLDGVSLVNPEVLYNDGYITVSSDFDYSPARSANVVGEGQWDCNHVKGRRVCARLHHSTESGKEVFWADAQDVATGVIVQGIESDTVANAVHLAVRSLFVSLNLFQ